MNNKLLNLDKYFNIIRKMINAREELLNKLERKNINKNKIKCAHINCGKTIILKINYTEEEFENFLNELDFKYNSGYGEQELYGHVWLNDNSWLERSEYDGSEKWKYKQSPEISKECLR